MTGILNIQVKRSHDPNPLYNPTETQNSPIDNQNDPVLDTEHLSVQANRVGCKFCPLQPMS